MTKLSGYQEESQNVYLGVWSKADALNYNLHLSPLQEITSHYVREFHLSWTYLPITQTYRDPKHCPLYDNFSVENPRRHHASVYRH
jgi:hypothetical protein